MSSHGTAEGHKDPHAKEAHGGKEAHGHGAEKGHGHEKADKVAKDTHDKAVKAAEPHGHEEKHDDHKPDVLDHSDDYKRPKILEYKPLPSAPTGSQLATFAAGALAVAVPPVGVPAAAAAWGWKRVKGIPPFSWAHNAVAGTFNAGKNLVGSMLHTASYPLRLAGAATANVARGIARPFHYAGERAMDFLDDLRVVLKQKFNVKDEKGESVSLPALAILQAKNVIGTLISLPLKGIGLYLKALGNKPLATIGGTALVAGILAANGGPLAFSKNLAEAVLQIFQGIAAHMTGGGAATGATGATPAAAKTMWQWFMGL